MIFRIKRFSFFGNLFGKNKQNQKQQNNHKPIQVNNVNRIEDLKRRYPKVYNELKNYKGDRFIPILTQDQLNNYTGFFYDQDKKVDSANLVPVLLDYDNAGLIMDINTGKLIFSDNDGSCSSTDRGYGLIKNFLKEQL